MYLGTQNRIIRLVGAGVVAAGLAAPAVAQSSAGGFERPLRSRTSAAPAAEQPTGSSTLMMTQQEGDDTYEIRIVDGKVTAKINGKKVPADRVVQDKDGVKVLDEDGNVVQRFVIMTPGGAPGQWSAIGGGGAGRVAPRVTVKDAPQWSPMEGQPKVMLGINMASPGEALNKNYGLEPGAAILIDKVIDGLAADRAGIRENDIVTEIDGKKPATPEALRDALKDKKPGDIVTFTVLRKGGNRAIRVKLDAFDADKLAPLMAPKAGDEWAPDANNAQEDMQRRLEEQFRSGQWRGLAQRGEGGNTMVFPPEAMELFVRPHVTDRVADMDKRMAELDEKLARLADQMAKIEAMMDKLAKQRDRE